MDIIFEIIMEVLVEGYVEIFLNLIDGFFPQKTISSKGRNVLTVLLAIFAMVIASASLIGLVELIMSAGKSILGWHLTGAGAVYLILGIILKVRTKNK